jgi:prepilin signal peptidase PulO-like enzyme (type II secretory pathway)
MDASRVSDSHVWPMRDEVAADDGKIWVTPKIPFIVPITFAVFFVALFGNVLFLL